MIRHDSASIVRWGILGSGDVTEVKSGPFAKARHSALVAVMRRTTALEGRGYFVDFACHTLDVLDCDLDPVTTVVGGSANQAGRYPAEDIVTGSLAFASGARAPGLWCFSNDTDADRVEIFGAGGRLSFATFDDVPVALARRVDRDVRRAPSAPHSATVHPDDCRRPPGHGALPGHRHVGGAAHARHGRAAARRLRACVTGATGPAPSLLCSRSGTERARVQGGTCAVLRGGLVNVGGSDRRAPVGLPTRGGSMPA